MTHSVNKLTLLRNKDFYLVNDKEKLISFTVPSFEDYISNSYLNVFLSLLEIDRSKYEGLPIESDHALVLFLIEKQMYTEEVFFTLHKYIPDLKIELKGFFVGEEYLTPDDFNFIISVWRVALGIIGYEDWISGAGKKQEPELDEFEKKIKEKEEKIRKIKSKSDTTSNNNTDLDRILITVMKEFNLKMSDLLPMNMFTIFWYYRYGLKINNYHIESIAYGNGLLKKMKHFSE